MWFELYKESCSHTQVPWRWRLKDSDQTVIAACTQGYPDETACREAILLLKNISPHAPIEIRRRARLDGVFAMLKGRA